MPATAKGKLVFIDFDGVYRNSEVWINGHYLGKRPYGYSSFEYDLTPFLNFGTQKNVIAVKVDNSQQPNSRWYSGSGIYRNVWLTTVDEIHVDHWGTYITTPEVSEQSATVTMLNQCAMNRVRCRTRKPGEHYLRCGRPGSRSHDRSRTFSQESAQAEVSQKITVPHPAFWSDRRPYLYKVVSHLEQNGRVVDRYETPFGIRSFSFDDRERLLP